MKKLLLIPILVAVLISSCKEDVWRDHENPQIYFPQATIEGVVFSTAWMYDSDEYTIPFGVTLSGVRPENQNTDITVGFSVNPALVVEYNSDIENFYEGRMVLMPANCFSVAGNSVTIPSGQVSTSIPVKIFTDEVANLPLLNVNGDTIVYVIPLVLTSSSKYNLHSESEKRVAFTSIILDQPRFYFWVNRAGLNPVSRRVVDIDDPVTENFLIASYGVPNDDDYVLTISVDTDHPELPAGATLLPANAYEILSNTVTIKSGDYTAQLPIRIINSEIDEYAESFAVAPYNAPVFYYLPVVIESASRYGADAEKGVLMLRVSLKNDFEMSYQSEVRYTNLNSGLSYAASQLYAPTSLGMYELRLPHMLNTWRRYKLTIIPNPADNTRWGVEGTRISDEGIQSTNPIFIFDTDRSYYNWMLETFFLYYEVSNIAGSIRYDVYQILEAQL